MNSTLFFDKNVAWKKEFRLPFDVCFDLVVIINRNSLMNS